MTIAHPRIFSITLSAGCSLAFLIAAPAIPAQNLAPQTEARSIRHDTQNVAAPLTTVSFTNAGSYTWTVPPDIHWIKVEAWGGGGAGGASGGGGGGGGGYARSVMQVTPGTVYQLLVGLGGSGNNGQATTFGSNLVIAPAGTKGQNGSPFFPGGAPGGAGGAGGTGNVTFSGGRGANGGSNGGGGGGSASTSGNGSGGFGISGGTAPPGGGFGGDGATSGVGSGGNSPGGGGGGSVGTSLSSVGASGKVMITFPITFTTYGRVLTSSGRGIRGGTVTVTGESLVTPILARLGNHGRYIIPNLSPGTYTLTFSARRFTFNPPSQMISSVDTNVFVPDVVAQ